MMGIYPTTQEWSLDDFLSDIIKDFELLKEFWLTYRPLAGYGLPTPPPPQGGIL